MSNRAPFQDSGSQRNPKPSQVRTSVQHLDIYELIRRDLSYGAFAPGQKLPIRMLAERYGTGLMPVREAVQRLAAERALSVVANKTVRVPLLSRDAFQELLTSSLMIEKLALADAMSSGIAIAEEA
ncbi:MAG: GntR family transcriptional regulator, partial [Pseudomonadota bacterium]